MQIAPGLDFNDVIVAARELNERLEALGLAAFAKTAGGKGFSDRTECSSLLIYFFQIGVPDRRVSEMKRYLQLMPDAPDASGRQHFGQTKKNNAHSHDMYTCPFGTSAPEAECPLCSQKRTVAAA